MDWTQAIIAALGGGALLEIIRRLIPSREGTQERLWNEIKNARKDFEEAWQLASKVRDEKDSEIELYRRRVQELTEHQRVRVDDMTEKRYAEVGLARIQTEEWRENYFKIKMDLSTVFLKLTMLQRLVENMFTDQPDNKALASLMDTIRQFDITELSIERGENYAMTVWRRQTDETATTDQTIAAMADYLAEKRARFNQPQHD
jgi:hypothetical protein